MDVQAILLVHCQNPQFMVTYTTLYTLIIIHLIKYLNPHLLYSFYYFLRLPYTVKPVLCDPPREHLNEVM